MEARARSGLTGADAAWSGTGAQDAPWFEPFRPWMARSDPRASGHIDLDLLNRLAEARGLRTEEGLPLRFADARAAPSGAYERVIREHGAVPTRACGAGMLHDWFNALAWLAWPRTKARLNRLHSDAIVAQQTTLPGRGALRDAATILDESGVLFVCNDPALAEALRRFDWRALFVDGRPRFLAAARVRLLGHGLGEKLLAPYKALCAHAWIVEAPAGTPIDALDGDALDAAASATLGAARLRASALSPLPLLGVPGWWPANSAPAFYDDAQVFRPGRRRGRIAPGAGRTIAGCGAQAPPLEEGPDSTGQDAG